MKKLARYISYGLLVLTSLVFLARVILNAREIKRIPKDAVMGLESNSYKVLGSFRLSDWAENVSNNEYLTVFQGKIIGKNEVEMRVFHDDGKETKYIGSLANQFEIASVKTIFIDMKGEKCIIGWVSPEISGKQYVFHIERPELDRSKWMYAELESTIMQNLFIVPFTMNDDYKWDSISKIAVQTKESLKRGFDGRGSYYELEKTFTSPINVSGDYNYFPIKQN